MADDKMKRDEHNQLVKGEAEKRVNDLTRKLISEERMVQKDMSFRSARGEKRDVCIFITVVQRNSVNGKIVLGDAMDRRYERWSEDDMYSYRPIDATHIEMMAREIPMTRDYAQRFIVGAWTYVRQLLIRMNVINAA